MIVDIDVGLINLAGLNSICVRRDEITLNLQQGGITLSGSGAHRTLCDLLYCKPTALTKGPFQCILGGRPLAQIDSVAKAGPRSSAPGLGRPLSWPIPQELLLLEGEKATWLWPRTTFRQIAYAKRASGAFYLSIGTSYYRITVNPADQRQFEADLRRFFPRSETSLAENEQNVFTVWPESACYGPPFRPRFTALSIEELPGYDAAVWEDSGTQTIVGGKAPLDPSPPIPGQTVSP